jgi:hypothetical protein
MSAASISSLRALPAVPAGGAAGEIGFEDHREIILAFPIGDAPEIVEALDPDMARRPVLAGAALSIG